MKITRRQLKKIVQEAKKTSLSEQWGRQVETGSSLIEFARGYSALGSAVQEQFDEILSVWFNSGDGEEFKNSVYEQNPNALEVINDKMTRALRLLDTDSDEAYEIRAALDRALEIASGNDGGAY